MEAKTLLLVIAAIAVMAVVVMLIILIVQKGKVKSALDSIEKKTLELKSDYSKPVDTR